MGSAVAGVVMLDLELGDAECGYCGVTVVEMGSNERISR